MSSPLGWKGVPICHAVWTYVQFLGGGAIQGSAVDKHRKSFVGSGLAEVGVLGREKNFACGGQALCRRILMGMLNLSSRSQRLPRVRLAWVISAIQLAATG